MNNKRIAIFQYEWPLQIHTINIALKLAQNGYRIDIFIKGCSEKYVSFEHLIDNNSITVYKWQSGGIHRYISYIRNKFLYYGLRKYKSPISKKIINKTLTIISINTYKCLIGVEKGGLIWAGKMAHLIKVPYMYYSLELYLEDHPSFKHDKGFNGLRAEEIQYHQGSKATIIQDKSRAAELLRCNGITETDVLYLPVSLMDDENRNKSSWLYERFSISSDKKLILYFGLICEDRLSFDLAHLATYLRDDCLMVLHGYGSKRDIASLKNTQKYNKLVISSEGVAQSLIKDVIASATIGLVMYGNDCKNDSLTAFASEKLALYLQSGIPIIALDIGNYRSLIDAYRCGELITDVKDIPQAVNMILDNYDYYSENAFVAFRELYRFNKYFDSIMAYLDELR